VAQGCCQQFREISGLSTELRDGTERTLGEDETLHPAKLWGGQDADQADQLQPSLIEAVGPSRYPT
jgi:hypothetical protein